MRKIANFYPTLAESWMLFGVLLLCQWISGLLATPLKLIAVLNFSWVFLLGYLLQFVLLVGFLQLYLNGNPWRVGEVSPAPAPKRIDVKVWLILLLLVPCLSILLEPLSMWIPYPSWFNFEELMKNFVKIDFPTFLSVVIAAPVLEEWLFRGVILKGLLKHSSPWKAILWSGFMFGLMHLNPWQGIPAMGLGIFFGWVYWRTGSLYLCVFMHFVNNGIAFMLAYFYPQAGNTIDMVGDNYGYLLLSAVVLLMVFGFLLYKTIGVNRKNTITEK